jgi:hypothetical protein
MCRFLSAIYHKEKGLLWDAYTDSHEMLIDFYELNDKKDIRDFVRIEFYPDNYEYCDAEKYALHIDESDVPIWFDEDLRKEATNTLRGIIERAIIKDKKIKCLLSGVYILCGKTTINYIANCRVYYMTDKANVGAMRGSSKVGEMWGSSKVGVMWESSNVGVMLESSKVGVMWESSKVGEMRGSSKVGEMRESSKVGVMWESSKVGEMRGSSKVINDNRK